jgi:hypothetical protein
MARFAEILDVAKELAIPDGVRMIIAEYAELTNEERALYLLQRHGGSIYHVTKKNGFKQILSMRINLNKEDTISIYDISKDKYNRNYPTYTIARRLREQFWRSSANGRLTHKLAPLWQLIYDEWIAL